MRLDRLKVNELSEAGWAWYRAYLEALDAKDIVAYGAFLSEDVVLVMNNAPPVEGRGQVMDGLAGYWQTFGTLEHEPLAILGSDRAFVLEALNHYTTLDGRTVTLRAAALTDRGAEGLATSIRLYSDTSPLFSGEQS